MHFNYQKLIQNESEVIYIKDSLEVDLPNEFIYKVEGYLYFKNEDNKKGFFSNDNILLRVINLVFILFI